ncbi:MAG: hypothetical protein Q9204_006201 [Flavoplaca sp. TL-2023a]
MEWNNWSGFQGNGIYAIFNLNSLNCVDLLDEEGTLELRRHTPNNPAQLWRITKWSHGDVYAIENVFHKLFLWSNGCGEAIMGNCMVPGAPKFKIVERDLKLPLRWSHQMLWAIDKSMCALERGNMVVLIGSASFRNVMTSGHVLAEGKPSVGGDLYLVQEALDGDEGRKQKWLLQKQPE